MEQPLIPRAPVAPAPTLPSASTDAGATPNACAKQTARATRQPVYLEFAFDVSGSMGKGDKPWHDRALKWEPVVAATKAFFEDARSEGFSAALTFFPADDDRCEQASYQAPDVTMQPLPSQAFGQALDAIGDEQTHADPVCRRFVAVEPKRRVNDALTSPLRFALPASSAGTRCGPPFAPPS